MATLSAPERSRGPSIRRFPTAAACLATLLAAPAIGQTISAIGTLPGWSRSEPNALSGDGSTVVGQLVNSDSFSRAFRWTRAGGTVDLGTLGFGSVAAAYGVSEDGHTVSGNAQGSVGHSVTFRWTVAGGMTLVDPLGNGLFSYNGGMSAAGTELTGTSTTGASLAGYRWSTTQGGQALANVFGQASFGKAISASGQTVAGHVVANFELPPPVGIVTGPRACRWTVMGGPQVLSGEWSDATAISGDGSVVVGITNGLDGTPMRATRWSSNGAQELGNPFPGEPSVFPTAVSGDGLTVGGRVSGESARGWIWTAELGMVDLNTYLPTMGIDLTGWIIGEVRGISIDGRVITGLGGFNGTNRGYVVDLRRDSDGDGLFDHWETDGIPYFDQNGVVQRYILPGANPLRKDIYVEVDAMVGRQPSPGAMARVIEAFDEAPVPAVPGLPFSLPGISLHIEVDDIAIPDRDYLSQDRWSDFHVDKAVFFTSATERTRPDHAELRTAKQKAYRYCIFAKQIFEAIGIAEMDPSAPASGPRIGGNDLIVAIGHFVPPPGVNIEDVEAGIFMHELGHTLGLYHGGSSPFQNFNPNHYSVMNYAWNGSRAYAPASRRVLLDYSRESLPTLNENALDETLGIQGTSPGAVVPIQVRGPNTPGLCGSPPDPVNPGGRCDISLGAVRCMNFVYLSGPVDWNNDGIISPSTRPVCCDCNGDYNQSASLACPNEWELLAYSFRDTPHYSNAIAPPPSSPCPTAEVEMFLSSLPPPPPPVECPVAPPVAPVPSPATFVLCVEEASFTVSPEGTGPFTVQWRWLDESQEPPVWVDFAEGWSQNSALITGAQEGSLRISYADPAFFGANSVQISCRVTDVCGQSADSGICTLLIGGTTFHEPSELNVAACPGGTAQFAISASSGAGPVTYRWLLNAYEQSDFQDGAMPHGTIVSGAQSPTLTLSNIAAADFPFIPATLMCIADDGCASAHSPLFSFSPQGVLVAQHPESFSLPCSGTAQVQFVTAAVGIAPLTYQWRLDGAPVLNGGRVSGADTAEMTITDPQSEDSGTYTCVVTSTCGSVETEPGWLDVGAPRLLHDPPHILPTCLQGAAIFETLAIGTSPISYQWMRGGVDLVDGGRIFGAQSPVLVIFGVQEADLTDYSVRVSNACGTITSQSSALTLYAPIALSSQPVSSLVCPTGSSTLSVSLALEQAGIGFQWQVEDALNPDYWQDLHDGPIDFDDGNACGEVMGSATRTLSVSLAEDGSCGSSYRFRCAIYHQCEFVETDAATITICPADFDCSSGIGVPDIFAFLAAWFAQDPRADFNSDGQVQVPDIFEFLSDWFAVCT